MTKDAAKNVGLVINLIVVLMVAFIDDYLFKTFDLQYLKFEFKDSFLCNIIHKILGDLLPELLQKELTPKNIFRAYKKLDEASIKICLQEFEKIY